MVAVRPGGDEMTCANCGKSYSAHVMDRCGTNTHVVIDSETLARALKTGHPRLLCNVLAGNVAGALADVKITSLAVDGVEVPR